MWHFACWIRMLLAFTWCNFFTAAFFFYFLCIWEQNFGLGRKIKCTFSQKQKKKIVWRRNFSNSTLEWLYSEPKQKLGSYIHLARKKIKIFPSLVMYRKGDLPVNFFFFRIITQTVVHSFRFKLFARDFCMIWENFSVIGQIVFQKRYINVRKISRKWFREKRNFMFILNTRRRLFWRNF